MNPLTPQDALVLAIQALGEGDVATIQSTPWLDGCVVKFLWNHLQEREVQNSFVYMHEGWLTYMHPLLGVLQWHGGDNVMTGTRSFCVRLNNVVLLMAERVGPKAEYTSYTEWLGENAPDDQAEDILGYL